MLVNVHDDALDNGEIVEEISIQNLINSLLYCFALLPYQVKVIISLIISEGIPSHVRIVLLFLIHFKLDQFDKIVHEFELI